MNGFNSLAPKTPPQCPLSSNVMLYKNMTSLSIDEAIARGQRDVNWPVWGLLSIPAIIVVAGRHIPEHVLASNSVSAIGVVAFPVCFISAWLWWSVSIPKWRLWAYERVDDIAELKRRAVEARLIWPDGSIFSRTEIKSQAHAARERQIELQRLE